MFGYTISFYKCSCISNRTVLSVLSEPCHCYCSMSDNPLVPKLMNPSSRTVHQSQGLSDIDCRLLKPNRLPKLHQRELEPKDSFIFLVSLARGNMFYEAWRVALQKTLYWLTTAHVLSKIQVPKPSLITLCDSRTNKTRNPTTVYF